MTTNKIKVKFMTKKPNYKKIITFLIIVICIITLVVKFIHMPVTNIYINGNEILSDKEIISLSELSNSPSYLKTYFSDIKSKLLKNKYIKNAKVKRKFPSKIYIEIEEYKPISIYKDKIILSSGEQVEKLYDFDYLPYIINDIEDIYKEYVKAFSKVNKDILLKISHIEYAPNDVDKERFILYMVDSNYVYITLSKIDKINKYNSIVLQLEGKKGLIYLDSGDYVEIKG